MRGDRSAQLASVRSRAMARRPATDERSEPALTVRFTRVSPTHHRLDLVRGGATDSRVLETRSVLFHDLVHFALESEAGLANGFYGSLARGVAYGELAAVDATTGGPAELVAVERVVGPLQGAWRGGVDPEPFVARLRAYHAQIGERVPEWLTAELVQRVAARLRALDGQWRATPFGATMELTFAVPRGPAER
jgi:hypothetical protein